MVFTFGCIALCTAFVFAIVCAYKFGKDQGWREVVRTSTPHEKDSMTLQAGETLVAVVEMKKGGYHIETIPLSHTPMRHIRCRICTHEMHSHWDRDETIHNKYNF